MIRHSSILVSFVINAKCTEKKEESSQLSLVTNLLGILFYEKSAFLLIMDKDDLFLVKIVWNIHFMLFSSNIWQSNYFLFSLQDGHNCCRNSSSCGKDNETTAVDFSTDPIERYNVHTYHLPLSDTQHGMVLKTFNEASLKQLSDFKLSKSVADKLIQARQRKGSFKHIRDLLLVEGLGFKKIEAVCNQIVNFDVNGANEERQARKRSRRLFVPEWSHHNDRVINILFHLTHLLYYSYL